MSNLFDYTDRIIKLQNRKFLVWFSKLNNITDYDELNVFDKVKSVYENCDSVMRECMRVLIYKVYPKCFKEVKKKADEDIWEEYLDLWLDDELDAYDPTMKYAYTTEVERKQARCAESILAVKDKSKAKAEVKTALRYWSKMCANFADIITIDAQIKAYKDAGVKKVKWIAMDDASVCIECVELNGKIFDIDKVPPRPHIGCRCILKPILK